MNLNTKIVNIVMPLITISLASVAIYTSQSDDSGTGAALFGFLSILSLLSWPLVLSIDKRISKNSPAQSQQPKTPQQSKQFKIIRAMIIIAALISIILAIM